MGLQPLRVAVREGDGDARVGVATTSGVLSEPVTVHIITANINATGKFCYKDSSCNSGYVAGEHGDSCMVVGMKGCEGCVLPS